MLKRYFSFHILIFMQNNNNNKKGKVKAIVYSSWTNPVTTFHKPSQKFRLYFTNYIVSETDWGWLYNKENVNNCRTFKNRFEAATECKSKPGNLSHFWSKLQKRVLEIPMLPKSEKGRRRRRTSFEAAKGLGKEHICSQPPTPPALGAWLF